MSLRLKPLNDRVIVRPDEAEESKGRIIIPDNAKEVPTQGTVLAAGPGEHRDGHFIPTTVKEGDRVIYGRYAAGELKLDGEVLAILKEDQIFGILTDVS